jgi:hypothetical protein
MPAQMPQGASAFTETILNITIAFTLALLFIIYVVIPGLHVLLYQSSSVQKTCEARDPKTRWTDRAPIPVLAVSIWLVVSGLGLLLAAPMGLAMFFTVLTGMPAILFNLVFSICAVVIAFLVYVRHPAAWWSAMAYVILFGSGGTAALISVDMAEVYRQTELLPEQQIALLEPFLGSIATFGAITVGAFFAGTVVYLLAVRRLFWK